MGKSSMEELEEKFYEFNVPVKNIATTWSWITTNLIPREEVMQALSQINAKIDKLIGGTDEHKR